MLTPAQVLAAAQEMLTLQGVVEIVDDLEARQQHWREDWRAFFFDGSTGADDGLLRFVPARLEVMHLTRQITPAPFGLWPAILVQCGEDRTLAATSQRLSLVSSQGTIGQGEGWASLGMSGSSLWSSGVIIQRYGTYCAEPVTAIGSTERVGKHASSPERENCCHTRACVTGRCHDSSPVCSGRGCLSH